MSIPDNQNPKIVPPLYEETGIMTETERRMRANLPEGAINVKVMRIYWPISIPVSCGGTGRGHWQWKIEYNMPEDLE